MDSRRDLALALSVILFGILVVFAAQAIRPGVYRDLIGPRAFPIGIGVLFVVGGSVLAVRRLRAMNAAGGYLVADEGVADDEGHPASFVRAAFLMVLTFAYAAVFVPLGYLIATSLYIVAALAAMQERKWLNVVATALVFTVATYVIFAHGLGARLPVGPLHHLFRQLGWVHY